MKKLVLFFLLLTLSATWSVRVAVRRSPPGDIIESRRPNLTLDCDVLETESDPVESVIWYYEGEVFRQISINNPLVSYSSVPKNFLSDEYPIDKLSCIDIF